MKTLSAFLSIWAGNSPVTGEFPAQTDSDAELWCKLWVKNREAGDLGRHRAHYDITVMTISREVPMNLIPEGWILVGRVPLKGCAAQDLARISQYLECEIHRTESITEWSFEKIPHPVVRWAKLSNHDDVIKWKPFSAILAICAGNSPFTGHRWIPSTKGQWRGALMFSLICVWINCWVNNHEAGYLRRYLAHYDVTVMIIGFVSPVTTSYRSGRRRREAIFTNANYLWRGNRSATTACPRYSGCCEYMEGLWPIGDAQRVRDYTFTITTPSLGEMS